MPRSVIAKHYTRLLAQWPQDILRPEVQFQYILKARTLDAPQTDPAFAGLLNKVLGPAQKSRSQEITEVNVLYSLLENRYKTTFPIPSNIARPHSDPEYYSKLERELVNTPGRSWMGRFLNRIKGMVRLQ